jgi:ATPase subunit of ABC transporter with duplicated ATPase domains
MYGGNLSDYEEQVAAAQETAARTVRTAEGEVRRQQRELVEARVKIDRNLRNGRKAFENKRVPKIVANTLKGKAQVSAGKHRNLHLEKLEEARDRLSEAELAVRDDAEIRIELPGTEVPAGRTVLTLPLNPPSGAAVVAAEDEGALRTAVLDTLVVRGPERIALLGPNGSGKTTLLKRIVEQGAHVPSRYLPQRLDLLDDTLSVLDNVRAVAPSASVNEVRARLARFLFRGERANQAAGTLSGGERFRATLAALLSAEPPPQLLLLDEPTNNLDMASVRQLAQALSAYRGALIVASHDLPFLETLGITRRLRQDREDGLAES